MTVLSLLADIHMFAVLELWPMVSDVITAQWLDRLRRGLCVLFEDIERSRRTDYM